MNAMHGLGFSFVLMDIIEITAEIEIKVYRLNNNIAPVFMS